MSSKDIFLILLPIMLLNSCYKPTEWEDVASDYDPVLNVIGIISLDENIDSFVGVYRTTNLSEVSMIFTGITDTIMWIEPECGYEGYWLIDSLYEPAGLIESAIVTISDGQKLYSFNFIDKELNIDPATNWLWDSVNVRQYKPDNLFNPIPDRTYTLRIEVDGFDSVTGELTTPADPQLDSELTPATLSASSSYEIVWANYDAIADKGLLTGGLIDSHVMCGGEFYEVIDLSEKSFTVLPDWCDPEEATVGDVDNDYGMQTQAECLYEAETQPTGAIWSLVNTNSNYSDCDDGSASGTNTDYGYCGDGNPDTEELFIRLMAMDDNYYQYFAAERFKEFSNFLFESPGTTGRSVGIEGGFGVFGAFASDTLTRVLSP